ncbi:LytR family transcriptional regulator [Arthrobacter cheniae]|uniref:LytR family transcriptional regulator n=1 Tax=Arthrobacter cheniae TaxID=1258888 RepID=A0A3A5M3Y4_9MICC|nr:LytR C-terminal domain-containing protein [Arthrobacter cheniae]RJT77273.1 LytR family transcriptional regulator [Arthrobacter cheniae]
MTDHPRDEFDKVPEASARQGVHRERLVPASSSGLALKITVGILALLIGLGAYFILPRLGLFAGGDGASMTSASSSTDGSPAGGTADPPASAEAAPDSSASSTSGPDDGSTKEPDNEPTASSGADPAGDADLAQTVNVLNGTGAPGLASVAAGRLESAGWSSALPGNWAGAPLDSSVVFYNGEAQRASAEAVAADLGIADSVDNPDISPDISVVLGPEFQ